MSNFVLDKLIVAKSDLENSFSDLFFGKISNFMVHELTVAQK
jgi:hypothetical protein